MKKFVKYMLFLLSAMFLITACTERIDISLKPGEEKLVVEGYLFETDSTSWVRLTKTEAYFSNEPPPPVSGASVSVLHDGQQWKLTESTRQPGWYFLRDTTFQLIPEDTFQLKIHLLAPVGGYSDFESSTTVPSLRIHIDSIQIEYATDISKWLIRYYGQDLPGSDYYLFNSCVNGKIVSDSVLQKVVREDLFFDGRYISGAVVQVLNENVLKAGDSYTLLASNITRSYYEYITALQEETEEKNPLFSGPPANVPGNINHGALGFFTAFQTTWYSVQLQGFTSGQPLSVKQLK